MRVLLDTHAFLWFVLNDPNLSPRAKATIEDPNADVLVSPASYWEIAIKVALGKLDLFAPYADFMDRGIAGNDFDVLPIEPRHCARLLTLPRHHKDPFDRILAAYGVRRLW